MQPFYLLITLTILLAFLLVFAAGYQFASAEWQGRALGCEGTIERMSTQMKGRVR